MNIFSIRRLLNGENVRSIRKKKELIHIYLGVSQTKSRTLAVNICVLALTTLRKLPSATNSIFDDLKQSREIKYIQPQRMLRKLPSAKTNQMFDDL